MEMRTYSVAELSTDSVDKARQRAMAAFESMRKIAAENGYMSDEEIEAEIMASRRERRAGL